MLKTKNPKREKKITRTNTKNGFSVSKKLIKVTPSLNYLKGENGQTSGLRSTLIFQVGAYSEVERRLELSF